MKKALKIAISALFVFSVSCCNMVSTSGRHFSKQFANVAEPQTDDERTLVGEYRDFLSLVDSLADVWEGTDTLMMRRLYYNQREQWERVEKTMKFQNIRNSLVEAIANNMDNVRTEINQKLSPELRCELYDFYEFFNLKKNYLSRSYDFRDAIDGVVHTNSYGEHYLLVKATTYEYAGRGNWPKKMSVVLKQPIKETQIEPFKQAYDSYMKNTTPKHQGEQSIGMKKYDEDSYEVGDGKPMVEVEIPDEAIRRDMQRDVTDETDWDATEL